MIPFQKACISGCWTLLWVVPCLPSMWNAPLARSKIDGTRSYNCYSHVIAHDLDRFECWEKSIHFRRELVVARKWTLSKFKININTHMIQPIDVWKRTFSWMSFQDIHRTLGCDERTAHPQSEWNELLVGRQHTEGYYHNFLSNHHVPWHFVRNKECGKPAIPTDLTMADSKTCVLYRLKPHVSVHLK